MMTQGLLELDDVRPLLRIFEDDAAEATRYVAIVGSRGYPRMSLVRERVRKLKAHFPGLVLVSGTRPGGRDRVIKGRLTRPRPGVDETAIEEAERLGAATLVIEPDWSRGRRAGPIRNESIVKHSDDLVAYWDFRSRGTASTILLAAEAGIIRSVYGNDGSRVDVDDAVLLAREVLENRSV